MARTRVVYGCAGTELSDKERAFYREAQPWGFILFARNVRDPQQVTALVSEMRETVGDAQAPVLIDQEGGRVARLKPPHWKAHPAMQRFGDLYRENPKAAREAAYLNARSIAQELYDVGISVDCVPSVDVPVPGADNVIGDRAFSSDPEVAGVLGRAVIDGMLDGGVLPVIKHMPGHGRGNADSHFSLPRVTVSESELRQTDFVPFRALSDCPLGMTGHVVYEALDADNPATTSSNVIRHVIRGEIGFGGLLFTDDLSMNALAGSIAERTRAALAAGCDVITHCNGRMDEMEQVASEAKALEGEPFARARAALAQLRAPKPFDVVAADARLTELMGAIA
ncbi:MAG: beta-N-acetylhexosaminidase [Alphaproteobacteria bacterium]|nr:beta-N-acetylhexosaminidase [Alphaproteobacteria bacterium]